MSAAAADPTGPTPNDEVLELCRAMVYAADEQSLVKKGWLDVVGLSPLSIESAHNLPSYREKWIAENITNNSNIVILKELNEAIDKYLSDPDLGDNNYTAQIRDAVIARINKLKSISNGGRTKPPKSAPSRVGVVLPSAKPAKLALRVVGNLWNITSS